MHLTCNSGTIDLEWGATRVQLDQGNLILAHMGCYLLGKLDNQYIPGYATPAEQGSDILYRDRKWSPHFRNEGCHRVVLAEEIVRVFRNLGAKPVNVLELDQSRGLVHRREY